MGTNYYLDADPCPTCGRCDEELHIGKSSAGWVFALHVIPERGINDLADWQRLWQDGHIRDEYGVTLSPGRMHSIVCGRSWRDGDWPDGWAEKSGYASEAEFHRQNFSERGPQGLLQRQDLEHGAGTWDLHEGEFS